MIKSHEDLAKAQKKMPAEKPAVIRLKFLNADAVQLHSRAFPENLQG